MDYKTIGHSHTGPCTFKFVINLEMNELRNYKPDTSLYMRELCTVQSTFYMRKMLDKC